MDTVLFTIPVRTADWPMDEVVLHDSQQPLRDKQGVGQCENGRRIGTPKERVGSQRETVTRSEENTSGARFGIRD